MREEKLTFLEMIAGIAIYILLLTAILKVANANNTIISGVLFGGAVAAGILFELYKSLQIVLNLEQKHAERYTVRHAMIRLFLMGAALVVGILVPKIFNVLGIMLGILGLKASAFLQPAIHKIIKQKI